MDLNGYEFSDSPFKAQLDHTIATMGEGLDRNANHSEVRGVEDALYLAVKKRMASRAYDGDPTAYLSGLMADVHDAKREHSETCYSNDAASDIFTRLKLVLVSLLSEA